MEIKDLYFDITGKKRKWRGRKDIRILTDIKVKGDEIINDKGRILEILSIRKRYDMYELICEEKFYDNSSQYWKRRAFTYFNKQLARQMAKSGRREYFTRPRTYRGFINKIYPVIQQTIDFCIKEKFMNKDLPIKKDWYLNKNDYLIYSSWPMQEHEFEPEFTELHQILDYLKIKMDYKIYIKLLNSCELKTYWTGDYYGSYPHNIRILKLRNLFNFLKTEKLI
jgi:hypothetical protein